VFGFVFFYFYLKTPFDLVGRCHSRFMYWNDHMWMSFFRGWESSLNVYSSQPV